MNPFDQLEQLGRNRCLHFGCGPHILPRPWENFDTEVDIAKPLPFPDLSADLILAEHVIEHIPFLAGLHFLRQCRRVLQPGGTLRLAFPDVTRFDEMNTPIYLDYIQQLGTHRAEDVTDIYRLILDCWGHQSCWTAASGTCALYAAGFSSVSERSYGRSPLAELDGIDGHHLAVSLTTATIETTVLEATK